MVVLLSVAALERFTVWNPAFHPHRRAVVERMELLLSRASAPTGLVPSETWPERPLVIAHAGGVVDSRVGTNTLEALTASYERGVRFLEVDLHWTRDRELVLVHDWDRSIERLFGFERGRLSKREFLAAEMIGDLTQLDLAGLAAWVAAHPDVWIVSDVKSDNIDALRMIADTHPDLAAQLVPQVYRFSGVTKARSLGYGPVILTIYRKNYTRRALVAFVEKRRMFALTIPRARAHDLATLVDLGTSVYLHTINQAETARKLVAAGASGVYSDTLAPVDLVGGRPALALPENQGP